jgi:hypothetical protein
MASPDDPPPRGPILAAHGWAGAEIPPAGRDASFRANFRVHRGERRRWLMDAPPEHEDVGPS